MKSLAHDPDFYPLGVKREARAMTVDITAGKSARGRWQDDTLMDCLQDEAESGRKLALYQSLINSSLDAMMVIDREGRFSDVNRATEVLVGMSHVDLIGSRFTDYCTEPGNADEMCLLVFQGNSVREYLLNLQHVEGRVTEVLCNAAPYRDDAGEIQGGFVIARDISELTQYRIQLEFQATCDPLTALPNRRYFTELLDQAIKRAEQHGNSVVVALADVDDFKDINDAFGYGVGDELLQLIARRLSGCVGESVTVGRVGGDEFAVMLENAGGEYAALVRSLQSAFVEGYLIDGHEIFVSGSIGIALYPTDADNAADLLRKADMAMYRVKGEGKGACQRYTSVLNSGMQRRWFIGHRLRYALQQSEFTLYYQPQIELVNGTIAGVEALIRWNSNGNEIISPAEFIPIAEQNGMIIPIGEWVMHQSCMQAKRWLDEEGVAITVAVNLSARQFRGYDVVKLVRRALDESGLPAHLLELELTEGMVMHDSAALPTLGALKDLGVTLAIDDFGTGYSSLSYLKRFPIDFLKIDRSFIIDVNEDSNDAAIVSAIIVMAHSLGLKVIAEGVDKAEQLDFLVEQGCDEIQGYFFSKPLPEQELTLLLRSGSRS